MPSSETKKGRILRFCRNRASDSALSELFGPGNGPANLIPRRLVNFRGLAESSIFGQVDDSASPGPQMALFLRALFPLVRCLCEDRSGLYPWIRVPDSARTRRAPLRQHLLRDHPDRAQPCLHQLRPSRRGKPRGPQPKRMSALRIQMHLHKHPSLLQRNVINQRLFDIVHVVILRM